MEESGHGGETLKEQLRPAPIIRILEWAARSRAKLEGNVVAQDQLTETPARATAAAVPAGGVAGAAIARPPKATNGAPQQQPGKKRLLSAPSAGLSPAQGNPGAGGAKPQKRTMRVKVTKSMAGAHGLTIETTGIGNVVTAVKEASPGAKAGIVSGMRILAINDIDMARATKKDCLVQIK